MAMRETVRSLKAYFIISALLSAAVNGSSLAQGATGVAALVDVLGLAFAMAFLYVGIRLRQMLSATPGQVTALLITAAVFLVLSFAYDLLSGAGTAGWPILLIGLLITWYLFVNVRRLAGESSQPQPQRP